jgi:hypothetical protein
MLVGDPSVRTAQSNQKMQNCYRCYTGPNFGGDTAAPCADNKFVKLPQIIRFPY